jgi:hypothetical protein
LKAGVPSDGNWQMNDLKESGVMAREYLRQLNKKKILKLINPD